jgi:hypothetical protein
MFDVKDRAETPTDGSDPLLTMRLALAEIAGEDRTHWPGPALSERLVELLEVRERLDAALIALTATWTEGRAWEFDGSLSPASWLEHRAPVNRRQALRLAKAGRLVARQDEIAESLDSGALTAPHVDALAAVVSPEHEQLPDDHVTTLVREAERLPVGDFSTVVRRWAVLADDVLDRDTFTRKWDRRHVHASVTIDGWVTGDFYLDPEAGRSVLDVLDHLAPPDPVDAPDSARSLSQRRADAMVDLAAWYAGGAKPSGAPPNLNVIVDVATLNGDSPEFAALRCDLEGVGPVTRATLEQTACHATVSRVVTAGDSVVLDMGRRTRLATRGQRRAVSIRDRSCTFPSCRRGPEWCDVHHVVGWFRGGPTDVDNLVLLCRRHHTLVHQTRWEITPTPGGRHRFHHPARGP